MATLSQEMNRFIDQMNRLKRMERDVVRIVNVLRTYLEHIVAQGQQIAHSVHGIDLFTQMSESCQPLDIETMFKLAKTMQGDSAWDKIRVNIQKLVGIRAMNVLNSGKTELTRQMDHSTQMLEKWESLSLEQIFRQSITPDGYIKPNVDLFERRDEYETLVHCIRSAAMTAHLQREESYATLLAECSGLRIDQAYDLHTAVDAAFDSKDFADQDAEIHRSRCQTVDSIISHQALLATVSSQNMLDPLVGVYTDFLPQVREFQQLYDRDSSD